MKPNRYGLIGFPISHSMSPALFYEAHPNSCDTYELIERESFEEAFSYFKEQLDAVNVTAPFKEFACKAADFHDEITATIEVANLLVKENHHIVSYNTDVEGVMNSLMSIPRNLSALVIGAGGAGKAAIYALAKMGYSTTIINRTYQKAAQFSKKISPLFQMDIRALHIEKLDEAVHNSQIIVYTLPLPLIELSHIDLSGKIILEANYRSPYLSPVVTNNRSYSYISGEVWLRAQALATWGILSKKG